MKKEIIIWILSFFLVFSGTALFFYGEIKGHQEDTNNSRITNDKNSGQYEEILEKKETMEDRETVESEKAVESKETANIWRPSFEDREWIISGTQENLILDIPILMFHYIQDIPANTTDQLGYRLSFSPQKLEELIIFLKENEIETLTFWDIKAIVEGKKEIPQKAIILNFDDGHLDHYTNAYPILKKHDAKAVFFVISNRPDNDLKYANWEQIREIANNGFEIGSHSVSHSNLSEASKSYAKYELEESQKKIEQEIGMPVISFCYPSGRYSNAVLNIAKDHYLFARTTRSGTEFNIKKRHQLPTVRIHPTTTIDDLKSLRDIN